MNNLTEIRSFSKYLDGKKIPAIPLTNQTIFVYDDSAPDPSFKYITGPIADQLYEYEQLGMDPLDIKNALDELKRWRAAYKDVGKEFDVEPPVEERSLFPVKEFVEAVAYQALLKGLDANIFVGADGTLNAEFHQNDLRKVDDDD